jgi:arylsulfatase A-like enzyme
MFVLRANGLSYFIIAICLIVASLFSNSLVAAINNDQVSPVYRLYNINSGEHLFTNNLKEYQALGVLGWQQEKVAFYLKSEPTQYEEVETLPWRRLYNPYSGLHHWTSKQSEYDFLGNIGWVQEGVVGHIFEENVPNSFPLFRLYNSQKGVHLLTVNSNEKDSLVSGNWEFEGIAGYVFAVSDETKPVIKLDGRELLKIQQGVAFEDPGATVTDNDDGLITVVSTGVVDTAIPGTYTIEYSAVDRALNEATIVKRTVIVNPSTVRNDSRPNIVFIFTDDQGYADIGAYNIAEDIITPNIDKLASTGVLMTDGYVTSPQCTPSRAGLMSGRYPQKFGVDDNRYTPYPLSQETIAEKLSKAGYKTGMVGKWHLELDHNSNSWFKDTYAPGTDANYRLADIPLLEKVKYLPENRGFGETFFGYQDRYRANFNLDGDSIEMTTLVDERFRVDVVSDAAVAYIERHKQDPFFLYVPFYAPHVPLVATEKYLSKFPGEMPERRRYALAMMSAIDEGVGRIVETLESYGIDDDTVIFFMSDNGAPLAMTKEDLLPVTKVTSSTWDGSLNDPWVGEKGMLSEGGIRVPYIVNWKGNLPEGLTYSEPVISLDASATAIALAGLDTSGLDGINLIPFLKDTSQKPDRALYFRFWEQSAIRKGKWKYLLNGNSDEYLFDMSEGSFHETVNRLPENPSIAAELYQELNQWALTLKREPGVSTKSPSVAESEWYDFYFSK